MSSEGEMVYKDLKSKFDQDGYIVIKKFLNEKETMELKVAGEKLTENVPAGVKTVFSSTQTKQVIDPPLSLSSSAILLSEELRVSDKSVWFYAQSTKLQVYFNSPPFGETMDYQAAPEVQSKNNLSFRDICYLNPIILNTVVADDYLIESADKISLFYEKAALDDDGRLLVDASLALNKVGHALHTLHPTFEACTYSDKVAKVCRALGLVKPVVPQSMYIYKNPGVGGEVISHQDSTFLFTEPESLVGFWIALDDATIENGCLWVIPGSHKSDVHKRFLIRNPDKSSGTSQTIFQGTHPESEQSSYVPLVVEKSSLVLIHGRVVHKSEQNKSQYSRHAYTFHVFDEGISQYSEQNWLQSKVGFKPLYIV